MCLIAGTYTAASCTECRKLFINWFLYLDEYVEMQWRVIIAPNAISTETRAVVAAAQHQVDTHILKEPTHLFTNFFYSHLL